MGVARAVPLQRSDLLRNSTPEAGPAPLPDEEIEQLRMESYRTLIRNHKRTAMQELIRIAIVLLVSCILFFVHWRLIVK
jgi:hypothetical protein